MAKKAVSPGSSVPVKFGIAFVSKSRKLKESSFEAYLIVQQPDHGFK